jgi:hypothetical protein
MRSYSLPRALSSAGSNGASPRSHLLGFTARAGPAGALRDLARHHLAADPLETLRAVEDPPGPRGRARRIALVQDPTRRPQAEVSIVMRYDRSAEANISSAELVANGGFHEDSAWDSACSRCVPIRLMIVSNSCFHEGSACWCLVSQRPAASADRTFAFNVRLERLDCLRNLVALGSCVYEQQGGARGGLRGFPHTDGILVCVDVQTQCITPRPGIGNNQVIWIVQTVLGLREVSDRSQLPLCKLSDRIFWRRQMPPSSWRSSLMVWYVV